MDCVLLSPTRRYFIISYWPTTATTFLRYILYYVIPTLFFISCTRCFDTIIIIIILKSDQNNVSWKKNAIIIVINDDLFVCYNNYLSININFPIVIIVYLFPERVYLYFRLLSSVRLYLYNIISEIIFKTRFIKSMFNVTARIVLDTYKATLWNSDTDRYCIL